MTAPTPDLAAILQAMAELPQRIAEAAQRPATIAQEGLPAYTGIPRATIFRLISAGQFPKAVAIPGSGKRYRRADIDRWIAALKPAK